jgi:16S rRNA processing protein RimM
VSEDRVRVGRILKAHGIRGEALVVATGSDPERLGVGRVVYLAPAGEAMLRIASARGVDRGWLVRFEGRDDRTSVEELAGAWLYQEQEALPPLPEGEYYLFELEGLVVTRADGSELGRVERVLDSPGTDIYEVRGPGSTWLIPGRREFVEWIDLQRGELRLTDRGDLLEAQASAAGKPDERRSARPGRPRRGKPRRGPRRPNSSSAS